MSVLEDIRFERSLPRENKEQILAKIGEFVRAWESNTDPTVLNRRFSVKKVQGDTVLPEVWKFKVSDGCRILFMKGKSLGLEASGYEDALILLRFCSHDEQIVKARTLSKVTPRAEEDQLLSAAKEAEAWADEQADKQAAGLRYDPETSITRVFKHIGIEALIDLERLQGIYYLNKNQRECVNADYRPLILFGSAGSGKTTIGVYKLVDLIKQNPGIKVGYFTYSSKLKKSAEKIFHTVLENELEPSEIACYESQVDFHPLRDWLKEETGEVYMVQYDQFNEQFFIPLRQNWAMNPEYKDVILNMTGYEAWREIRGLIKGYAGDKWQVDGEKILSEEEYARLSQQHSFYTKAQCKVLYALALKYVEWQKANGMLDENDLCRKLFEQSPVTQYDWIVIDEVQDLTELEIYLLQTRVGQAGNFLLSGDYHQTIAPTYFDTKRIMTLLEHHNYRYKEDANRLVLTHNYRNPKQIVALANGLSQIRKQLLGADKRNDYDEEIAMCETEGTIYTLCGSRAEKMKLLREAVKKAYVYIVVATEREKEELEELLQNKIRIFTVYEVKGLENKYIIAVNLLSKFKKQWEIIREYQQILQEQAAPVCGSYFYRYMINMLYVTLTRAQENLCFIEDEMEGSFMTELFQVEMQHEKVFDEAVFELEKDSSGEDFYMEALKFEAAEDYRRALMQYEKLRMPKARVREEFCRGKLYEEEGKFAQAGSCYEKAKEWEAATGVYFKAKDYKKYYECFVKWDEQKFMKEIIMNEAISYEKQLKPYMSPVLRNRIERLCMNYYIERMPKYNEEQDYANLWGQDLIVQIEEATQNLERVGQQREKLL